MTKKDFEKKGPVSEGLGGSMYKVPVSGLVSQMFFLIREYFSLITVEDLRVTGSRLIRDVWFLPYFTRNLGPQRTKPTVILLPT